MKRNKFEIDMCNGPIMTRLISFALPLCASSILQLMFNAVDIIVVGRFTGKEALAAVGATSALINLFINLFVGISLGANVMTARHYATGADDKVSTTVHTSILFAFFSGVLMVFVGLIGARPALNIMDTPQNVIEDSVLYMKIYFCGMPFFMLYNYGAAILRAVGDTKRPLIFLIISGTVNACLNVFLVVSFDMGVAGVAIATVISQCISCCLVLSVLFRTDASYKLSVRKLKIDSRCLIAILRVGFPAGIQSTVISLSNSMLQSAVNSFGDTAMAGYTAANNIFGFLYVSVNSVSQACMSFTSQNYGARKLKRMDRVLADCVIIQVLFPLALGTVVYLLGSHLIGIYNKDADVIAFGVQVLAYTTVPYFICGLMDLFPGALRGMGQSTVPMILSIIGTVGMRIVWIYGIFPSHRSVSFLFISYPVSWIVTFSLQLICFFFVRKAVRKKVLAETPELAEI